MPTTRPRIVLTETDALSAVLDDAARRWPDDAGSRSRLLLHLVEEGHRAVTSQVEEALRQRIEAIEGRAGVLTGVYEPGYLEQLREDWPE